VEDGVSSSEDASLRLGLDDVSIAIDVTDVEQPNTVSARSQGERAVARPSLLVVFQPVEPAKFVVRRDIVEFTEEARQRDVRIIVQTRFAENQHAVLLHVSATSHIYCTSRRWVPAYLCQALFDLRDELGSRFRQIHATCLGDERRVEGFVLDLGRLRRCVDSHGAVREIWVLGAVCMCAIWGSGGPVGGIDAC
jgi:hypothetical protein